MDTFDQCIIKPGTKVDLTKIDPNATFGWNKNDAQEQTQQNFKRIAELQELLYAEKKRGLLIVLQAMDTGGKDGTVRTVGGAMNPAGVQVVSFKSPTEEEKKHGFLWRIRQHLPKLGQVVFFNRSQYEDVCIARIHNLVPENVWRGRYKEINDFEEGLAQPTEEIPEGTSVLKFFLHISKDEQWERFRDRIDNPAKQWKLSEADLKERQYWDDYMKAYSDAITNCSTETAPWAVVPANHKWMRDLIISQITVNHLEGLNMQYPKPSVDIEAIRKKYFSDDQPPSKKPPSPRSHFNPK